jgi:hypothetical protein
MAAGAGMAPAPNPYAAPKAALEVAHAEDQSLWRSGKILVCRRDAVFPQRCIKCNSPAQAPPVRYKFSWHHSAWYLLVIFYLVVYLAAALVVRKRAELHVGLCARHARRRLLGQAVTWGGFATVMAMVYLIIAWRIDALFPYMYCGFAAWAIAAVALPPRLQPTRIDKHIVRIKGCGTAFLESLPEYVE